MDRRRWAAGLMACLLLTGCASAPDPADTGSAAGPTVPTATALPSEGRSLADRGLSVEVARLIWLPSDARLTYTAEQPNLVIVTGPADQAGQVQDYLSRNLPGLGWRITAEDSGGLLFDQGQWRGAYALGQTEWALTVRDD